MGTSDVCLNVIKYSHATGVAADNGISWAHSDKNATDIFLLLNAKNTDPEDGELMLRVVRGAHVLVCRNIRMMTMLSR